MTSFLSSLVMMLLAFAWALPAQADFRVEISGVGVTQIPIAIANFRGEDNALKKSPKLFLPTLNAVGNFAAHLLAWS